MTANKQKNQPLAPASSKDETDRPTKPGPRRAYLPKRQRKSIKLDRVNPQDLTRFDVRFFCEDCSHYSASELRCTMGYVPQHLKESQMRIFNLSGMMAFCRFLEID